MKNLYKGLLLTIWSVGLSSLSWGQCFISATNLPTNNIPVSVVVSDFDGDGKLDMATANRNSNTVSVLLNNGSVGFFGISSTFRVGKNPRSIAVGDFNGDGKSDLITANADDNTVSILLNNGSVGVGFLFGTAANFTVGSQPHSVAVGDFNSDGKLDVVTANELSNTVSVLVNNGAGGFNSAISLPVGDHPYSVAVGDFNGDAKPDLVTANNFDGSASVILNNGSGGFGNTSRFLVGSFPVSVIVNDFNGDGKSDLATANFGSNSVGVLIGTGNGSFSTTTSFFAGYGPVSLTAGDFNGDGKIDLASANYDDNAIAILAGNGNGTFTTPTNFSASGYTNDVAAGDFNSDGKPDLAVAAFTNTANFVAILINQGGGSFDRSRLFTVNNAPVSIITSDINGDGKLDLITANPDNSTISVLLGYGNGSFDTPSYFSVGAYPLSVTAGDFDGDGKPDLATANVIGNSISILLNNGNGSFSPATNVSLFLAPGNAFNSPNTVKTGDFNKDGALDLVTSNSGGTIAIFLNNGHGRFLSSFGYSVGNYPSSVETGDLNNDGKLDIVTSNQNPNTVSVLLGKGDGFFNTATNFNVGGIPSSVIVGDVNADGKLDLVTANGNDNTVSVLLGNGSGSFGFVTNLKVAGIPVSVVIGDFTADNKPDIATANFLNNSVSVLLGNTNGSFSTGFNLDVGFAPYSIAAGDFNADGKPDLVTANGGSTISVLLNCTPSISFAPTTYDCTTGQLSISTTGGNGAPVEYRIAGLRDFSTSPTFTVPSYQRNGTTFTLEARQSGQTISVPFLTACQSTTTTLPTSPTQPTGTGLSLITPTYDCNVGLLTLTTTGGNGTPIDYRIAGLRDYAPSPTFTVPTYQRTGTSFTLEARQSGVVVTLPFTSACQSATTTPPTPTGGTLIVSAQPVNCQTGTLQLTTTGGDGTSIDFKVPGLRDYSASATFTVPAYQRSNTTFTLYARQSGREVTGTYAATCPVNGRLASAETPGDLRVVVYPNPVGEQFSVSVSGASGQLVRFHLTTLNGQTVVEQQVQVSSDAHSETLKLPASAVGLYLLRVSTPTQNETVKVLRR